MIKKFDDFKNNRILDKERESLERELRTRKIMRDSVKQDLNINLDFIKRQIMYSIAKGEDYILTMGKRKEELEGTSETVFHIEFENEKLGRVRIFKPKDTATKGHYELNGQYYETSAKEIRDFYHILNQEIKGKPIIIRNEINESIRDKMTPKSPKEIEKTKEEIMDEFVSFVLDYYPEKYNDYLDTLEYFNKYEDFIYKDVEDGMDIESIAKRIIEGEY
jgi:hypothetical protein